MHLLSNLLLGAASIASAASSSPWLTASWPIANATGVAYETIRLTALTTYCPEATESLHNGVTYTVTAETTLTITDCPCTVTRPIQTLPPTTMLYTSCPPTASPPPPPNNHNNNGNVITVTNSAGQVVTVTSVVQNNAPVTGIPNAVPTGGAGNGTAEFTGEAGRVVACGMASAVAGLVGVGVLFL